MNKTKIFDKIKQYLNNPQLYYDKIIENMPEDLNQIEKARYIYIELGKFFVYDEKYIVSESSEEKAELFNKDVDDILSNKIICASLSRIYEYMLRKVGINASTVVNKDKTHAFTEVEIDGEIYYTDLVSDLTNIKIGGATDFFMSEDPDDFESDRYTVIMYDKLKRIDDKLGYTYNRNVYG